MGFIDSLDPTEVQALNALVAAVATEVLVALTARYVRLTHEVVKQARAAREPLASVDIEVGTAEARFLVGNSGHGGAHNLRFEVEEHIRWTWQPQGPSGISSLSPILNGIMYLARAGHGSHCGPYRELERGPRGGQIRQHRGQVRNG